MWSYHHQLDCRKRSSCVPLRLFGELRTGLFVNIAEDRSDDSGAQEILKAVPEIGLLL